MLFFGFFYQSDYNVEFLEFPFFIDSLREALNTRIKFNFGVGEKSP